jgi:hypothetical protein
MIESLPSRCEVPSSNLSTVPWMSEWLPDLMFLLLEFILSLVPFLFSIPSFLPFRIRMFALYYFILELHNFLLDFLRVHS